MAKKYEDIVIITNSNEKHGPGTNKRTYTAINAPLYTTNGDKIVYSTDINWKDIILSNGSTSIVIQDTATLLNFIATRFNLMNEDITALDNRIKELENNKQATVVSIDFDTDNMYDPEKEYFEGEKIIYTGETVKFSKPKVKLTFSDGSVEYVNDPNNDSRITWIGTKNPVEINGTQMANTNVIDASDQSSPIDTSFNPVASINYFNYHKFNKEESNPFWGDEGYRYIYENLNPLKQYENGKDIYRILDKYIHCKSGNINYNDLESPEYDYKIADRSYQSLDNSYCTVNINDDKEYIKITNNYQSYDKFIKEIRIRPQYNDELIPENHYRISNILLAPKKNITVHFNNETYDFPLKAACEVEGNKTLSGQYTIDNLDTKYSELKPYIDSKDIIIGDHALLGFRVENYGEHGEKLRDIFDSYNFKIDYIKKPDSEWYKRSYMNDSNWQNRPNSYYAYFDAVEYNSNPRNIYAYMGNRIMFSYDYDVFDGMPDTGYAYVGENTYYPLPRISNNSYNFGGWYTNSSYTGEGMTDTYRPTENITLYAKFTQQTPEVPHYFSVGTEEVTSANYTEANNAITTIPTTTTYWNNSGAKKQIYILVPSTKTITIVDASISSPITFEEDTSVTIPTHKVYKTTRIANGGGITITISNKLNGI